MTTVLAAVGVLAGALLAVVIGVVATDVHRILPTIAEKISARAERMVPEARRWLFGFVAETQVAIEDPRRTHLGTVWMSLGHLRSGVLERHRHRENANARTRARRLLARVTIAPLVALVELIAERRRQNQIIAEVSAYYQRYFDGGRDPYGPGGWHR